jgi:hypothetical protein
MRRLRRPNWKPMEYKTLVKANNDLISHCACAAPIATTGQADCPWCGCGWLFTCVDCRKAFTFAKVALTDTSPVDLVRRDLTALGLSAEEIDGDELAAEAEWMTDELDRLNVGDICVFMDGNILSVAEADIEIEGWFAKHSFDVLPQVAALSDPSVLDKTLKSLDYWLERELEAPTE